MSCPTIHLRSSVCAIMEASPATVQVFVRFRMHCPGCTMSPFMTVADAARSYGLDADVLLDELRAAAGDQP